MYCDRLLIGIVLLLVRAPLAHAQEFDTSAAPDELPYEPRKNPPLGYHLEAGPRAGAVASGIALFGLSYGAVVAIGAADKFENKKGYFLVPVLGPALWMSSRSSRNDGEAVTGFLIAGGGFDLLLQVASLALVVREYAHPPKRFTRDARARLVAPLIARGFFGLSVAGEL